MTIWDDICAEQQEMPKDFDTVVDVLRAIHLAITLFPIIGVAGLVAKREFLVKMAATMVHGIELMDAEIEATADNAYDPDDYDYP